MSTPDASTPEDGRTFRFDGSSGEIHGPAGTARLAPQPGSVLTLLIERRGEVVGRNEIKNLLWPAGGVDVNQGLAFALREVRRGLEDAGCDPGIVETIPRRGYRLSGDTSSERGPGNSDGVTPGRSSDPTAGPPGVRSPDASEDTGYRSLSRRSRVAAAVGIVTVLAALVTTYLPWPPDLPVIALFQHETEDTGLASLAGELGTALTTVLTDSLAGVAGIVGPTGTASLDGANDTEGARDLLGACLVASGHVSAIGSDSVRVFTQVVRTGDRVHTWASVDTLAAEEAVARVAASVLAGARTALAGC